MNVQELVKECKLGSTAAQKCLFDLYADPMMVLCCRYVKNREDAEEIMLDGFYKFFKNIVSFQYMGETALYAWIKRIMINECLMFLRKKNAFVMTTETEAEQLGFSEDVLNKLSTAEIFKLIVQLPVGYRTVFNLFAVEGMSHKEIAAVLKITDGTSKSQLNKARALLQKMILQNNNEDAGRKIK
jgi:RNA polymerase sigma factor (sigma-70 family)